MAAAADPDWTRGTGWRRGREELYAVVREAKLAPVRSHPFRLGHDESLDCAIQFFSAGSRLQVERSVESMVAPGLSKCVTSRFPGVDKPSCKSL